MEKLEPPPKTFSLVVETQRLNIAIASPFLRAFAPVSEIDYAQGLGAGEMGWEEQGKSWRCVVSNSVDEVVITVRKQSQR